MTGPARLGRCAVRTNPPKPAHSSLTAEQAFVGSTPRAIRHYHEIGLLPEPERGGDDRRRYGYEDMIRLLWIRKTTDAGIALDDIRGAFTTGTASAGADSGEAVAGTLERLEETLAAQEAELRRQRTAVQRMRAGGSRVGLLSGFVTERLNNLPEGSVRQADLDSLLVTERIFGPLGAAAQATRFVVLATHPTLREASDRVDDAEGAVTVTARSTQEAIVVDLPHLYAVSEDACPAGEPGRDLTPPSRTRTAGPVRPPPRPSAGGPAGRRARAGGRRPPRSRRRRPPPPGPRHRRRPGRGSGAGRLAAGTAAAPVPPPGRSRRAGHRAEAASGRPASRSTA
ncbi:transcriptional regulator [Streptomyces sp. GBA 94-10 4N24]|nr:transcriptional regulator [Streptomyces sp. GBA 94-10 4N24]UZN62806.1 transcriptional regulator [Streptomyces sp. GBA 94-10 4N24]